MAQIESVEALEHSAKLGGSPPDSLDPALRALWFTKAGRWEEAHEIAQEIHSALGSWIHGLLHLIEGDLGNSAYWYSRAGRSQPKPSEIDADWLRIAGAIFSQEKP